MSINNFIESKSTALNNLKKFKHEFLLPLKNIEGIEIAKELSTKISNVYQNINDEDFVIAMFGAFSDGKSTVIKAITGEENIEISPVPTTDKIQEYQYNQTLKIIDTPGLFSENLDHSEKTKKFISEANLIIYLLDPVNPLKKSQHEVIKWLLNDLNKAESTIIVLNKMDSVADLYDEEEFNHFSDKKKGVVIETLEEIGVKINHKNILAIAADPYGEGLDYWNDNKEEYREISKIESLTKKIDAFIPENKNELIIKSANSVLKDCSNTLTSDLNTYITTKKELLQTEKSELDYSIATFSDFKKDVGNAYNTIRDNIEEVRKEYITSLASVSNEKDLKEFCDLYLGENFELLSERIEKVVREKTEHLLDKQRNVIFDIENTAKSYQDKRSKILEVSGVLGGQLSKTIASIPVDNLRTGIMIFRNFTNIPVKFKPWGIVKLAKGIKGAGTAFTVVMEGIGVLLSANKQNKFNSQVTEIKEAVIECFRIIKSTLNYNDFINMYFPSVAEFDKNVEVKNKEIKKQEDINMKLIDIIRGLERFSKNI